MKRKFLTVIIGVVGLGALGISAGVANGQGSGSQTTTTTTQVGSMYSYYRSMMGRFDTGSMMGESMNSMMAEYPYRWMLGGARAPGWMDGATLPKFMMGTNTDPGIAVGSLFADAPGPRVSSSDATKLGNQLPNGATVSTKKSISVPCIVTSARYSSGSTGPCSGSGQSGQARCVRIASESRVPTATATMEIRR